MVGVLGMVGVLATSWLVVEFCRRCCCVVVVVASRVVQILRETQTVRGWGIYVVFKAKIGVEKRRRG